MPAKVNARSNGGVGRALAFRSVKSRPSSLRYPPRSLIHARTLAVSFWRRGGRPGADSGVSLSPGPLSAMMLIRPYAKKTVAAYLSRCRRQPPIESTPRLKRQAWANGFTSDVGRSWKPKRRRHRLVEQAASNTTIGNVDYPKREACSHPTQGFF